MGKELVSQSLCCVNYNFKGAATLLRHTTDSNEDVWRGGGFIGPTAHTQKKKEKNLKINSQNSILQFLVIVVMNDLK